MKKIITLLIATLCISGFQVKAHAGTGADVAGAVIGTVLCAGIVTAAILDCDDHGYRHHRRDYYRERDYRHHRSYSRSRSHYDHHHCD